MLNLIVGRLFCYFNIEKLAFEVNRPEDNSSFKFFKSF